MLLEIRRDPDYRHSRSFQLNRRFHRRVSEVFESAMAAGEFRQDVSVSLFARHGLRLHRALHLEIPARRGDFAIDEWRMGSRH